MIKIKVQSRIPVFVSVLLFTIAVVVIGFIIKYVLFDYSLSYSTRNNAWELIFLLLFFVPIFFNSSTSKDEYVSDLLISNNTLEIIYKVKNKVVEKERIALDNIKGFKISAVLNNMQSGRTKVLNAQITTKIRLNNDEVIMFDNTGDTKLIGCPYQYILDILKVSSKIPNFSLKLTGNSEFDLAYVNYFKLFGKKLPFIHCIKYQLKAIPKPIRITLCISLILFLFGLSMLGYMFLPAMPLTKEEKQYYQLYNEAIELKKSKNYVSAIQKLNAAQNIIETSSDSYLQKAYCYEYLKQYDSCLAEAKEGLKYVDKKPIYYKAKNYKFSDNDKFLLNSVLGDCGLRSNNYNESLQAFSYVINNSQYMYTDAYFKRGKAYYYLGQYNLALADFIKHKSIIEECLKNSCSVYKAKNLNNINKWINASTTNINK